jgi:hypothetical protein
MGLLLVRRWFPFGFFGGGFGACLSLLFGELHGCRFER